MMSELVKEAHLILGDKYSPFPEGLIEWANKACDRLEALEESHTELVKVCRWIIDTLEDINSTGRN